MGVACAVLVTLAPLCNGKVALAHESQQGLEPVTGSRLDLAALTTRVRCWHPFALFLDV